jgi:hypothetical protein
MSMCLYSAVGWTEAIGPKAHSIVRTGQVVSDRYTGLGGAERVGTANVAAGGHRRYVVCIGVFVVVLVRTRRSHAPPISLPDRGIEMERPASTGVPSPSSNDRGAENQADAD